MVPRRRPTIRVAAGDRAMPVPIGPRWAIPSRFSAVYEDPALPFWVSIDVITRAGRPPQITRLECEERNVVQGSGITSPLLRRVLLGNIMDLCIREAREKRLTTAVGTYRTPSTPEGIGYGGRTSALRKARNRPPSKELLMRVAAEYRAAVAGSDRGRPTEAVATLENVSRSTAARWVRLARDEGLLGPAQGTKPGEGSPNQKGRGKR